MIGQAASGAAIIGQGAGGLVFDSAQERAPSTPSAPILSRMSCSFRPASALRTFGIESRATRPNWQQQPSCEGGGWCHAKNQCQNCRLKQNIGPQCEGVPLCRRALTKDVYDTVTS